MRWRQRKDQESDLDRELRSDLDLETAEQQERGLSPEDARYAAQRALGNTTLLKEEVRTMWTGSWLDGVVRDLRYGIRQLKRDLGLTAVVVATLALGVGGNTAIFSVLRGVLLRSLPYRDSERLVAVWEKDTGRQQRDKVTGGNYTDWKARNHAFEDMAYCWDTSYTLTGAGAPQSLYGYQFSPNFFTMLGARPLLGRTFEPEDGKAGHDHVAVLSYHLWQDTFAGEANIVGRAVQLDGQVFDVIGVMPADFAHPSTKVDLWTPLPFPTGLAQNWRLHVFQVLARLKPRVDVLQAKNELIALARQTAEEHPGTNLLTSAELEPVREAYVRNVRPALWILQTAVFIMLVIACGNVANMLLARASKTEREIAVRVALGAGRWALLRQYMVQGLILSVSGAGLGIALAFWGVGLLLRLFRDQLTNLPLPDHGTAWVDWPVLAFTISIAATAGLIFGVVPALRRATPSMGILKAGGRGATERPVAIRFRSILIVGQVALSLVLLVGAGLLTQSFLRLMNQPLGFQTDHVLNFVLTFPPNRYSGLSTTASFLQQTLNHIRAIPGVDSAASISTPPLTGMDARRPFLNPNEAAREAQTVQYRVITPDYFRVMRIPLRNGRFFDDGDRHGTREVVIINERLARRLWPHDAALGKTLNVADISKPEPREIVVVVGDVHHAGLASEPPIEVYRPAYQASWPFVGVVVRSTLEPTALMRSLREAVRAVDKDEPITNIRTMDELAADSVALRRASTFVLAAFAGLALFLASLGIYSVISYSVTLRTHEIGVRMALGARMTDVLMMTLRQSVVLTIIGIAAGLICALALTRFLASLLFGIAATDPLTIASAIVIMAAVSVAAAYVPALRAARVDPMVALRYE